MPTCSNSNRSSIARRTASPATSSSTAVRQRHWRADASGRIDRTAARAARSGHPARPSPRGSSRPVPLRRRGRRRRGRDRRSRSDLGTVSAIIRSPTSTRRWAAAKYWALLIRARRRESRGRHGSRQCSPRRRSAPQSRARRLLDQAVDEIGRSGLPAADAILARRHERVSAVRAADRRARRDSIRTGALDRCRGARRAGGGT